MFQSDAVRVVQASVFQVASRSKLVLNSKLATNFRLALSSKVGTHC